MQTALFTKVFGDRTLEKAFELTAELGYDAVELMCREPHLGVNTGTERAHDLRDRLDELGLEVAGMGTYTGHYVGKSEAECGRELEKLEHFIDLSDVFETDLLRHGAGGPPDHEAEPEHFEKAATWLGRAADLAADHGKRLGIEIHASQIPETAESAIRLLKLIDRDNVGAIHDAGNMYIVDTEFGRSSVETLGDHLCHVHVKDVHRVDDPSLPGAFELETRHGPELFQHRLLGHGGADHGELIDALTDAEYNGYLSVECHRPTDGVWTDRAIAAHEREAIEVLINNTTRS